jgi:hypothetical protein
MRRKLNKVFKTFTLAGHRYRIVALYDKGIQKDVVSRSLKMYDGLTTGLKRLSDGRWAIGVRVGTIGRSGLKVR